jgi:5-methyltetrahydropteroyltriglutamate--homocysteine methyltransferase
MILLRRPRPLSSDCGFGRQGGNREIAFFKTVSIAQGANIVRRELGLPVSRVPAADPLLQTDIVPKSDDAIGAECS